jgi:hypothetical protein
MNEGTRVSESALLKARVEKAQRAARANGLWQRSFMNLEAARLGEDGGIVVEASSRIRREDLDPALMSLSECVGFSIKATYEELPKGTVSHSNVDLHITESVQTDEAATLGVHTSDERRGPETPTEAKAELVREGSAEKKPSPKPSGHEPRSEVKHRGIPMDIRASQSFLRLPCNGKGLLKLMYGHSFFDSTNARRVYEGSRNGLAVLLEVTPRTVTNLMRELMRLSLVKRLKRGYPDTGISIYELPTSMRHVHWWRMERAGKSRY